jgi:hypothetical protein
MLPKWICGRLAPLDFGSSLRDISSFFFSQRRASAFGLGEPRLERILIRRAKEPPDRPQQPIEPAKSDRPRMSHDAPGIPAGAVALPSGGLPVPHQALGSWRLPSWPAGNARLRAATATPRPRARAAQTAADTKVAEAT